MTQRTFFLVCLLGVSLCSARFNEGDDIIRPMSAIDELEGNAALSERALLSNSLPPYPPPYPSPPSPFPPLAPVENVTTQLGTTSNESTTYTIQGTFPVSGNSTQRKTFIDHFLSYLGNGGVLELTRSRRLLQTPNAVEEFAKTLLDAAMTSFNATAGKITFTDASSGLATSIELYFSSKADEPQNGLNTFNSEIQSSSVQTALYSASTQAAEGSGVVLSIPSSGFSVTTSSNGARLASMHAGVLALLAAVTAAVLMA